MAFAGNQPDSVFTGKVTGTGSYPYQCRHDFNLAFSIHTVDADFHVSQLLPKAFSKIPCFNHHFIVGNSDSFCIFRCQMDNMMLFRGFAAWVRFIHFTT